MSSRVLVVEDEPLIAMMVEEWLVELGCEVVGPASSVASALTLVEKTADISAAVLDVSLANEDSSCVADALQKLSIPFVFATGYGSNPEARFLNVNVLNKPFVFEDFRQVLTGMLAGEDSESRRVAPDQMTVTR